MAWTYLLWGLAGLGAVSLFGLISMLFAPEENYYEDD